MIDERSWQKCAEFHGHKCRGLAIGYQAARYAAELLGTAYSYDEELVCIAENVPTENITLYVSGSKFRSITGNNKLSDEEVLKIIELLDDVSPKGVFREFNEDIRQRSSKKSKR